MLLAFMAPCPTLAFLAAKRASALARASSIRLRCSAESGAFEEEEEEEDAAVEEEEEEVAELTTPTVKSTVSICEALAVATDEIEAEELALALELAAARGTLYSHTNSKKSIQN